MIWEVARRELVERSRSRAFRISLVVLLILSIAGAVAAARLSGPTSTADVAVVGAASLHLEPVIRAEARHSGQRIRLERLDSEAAAARAVRSGTVDVALIDGHRLLVKSSRSGPGVSAVRGAVATQAVLDRLRASGLTETQALSALEPRPVPVAVLEPMSQSRNRDRGLIYIGLLVLYIALLVYGTAVAQGVTEEKASRVVELLLTTVSPRRLLTGKVLGIGVLGLAQLAVAGCAALIAGRLAGGAGLPSAAPAVVALVVLWFVLGYALYSVACAAIGALVSRQEDLQSATAPITALLVGAFLLATFTLQSPDGTVARVAAFVPPFAPMIVPSRVVLGDMGPLGLASAIGLDLLATAALITLAARIYERAILHIGAPIRLRRALMEATGRRS